MTKPQAVRKRAYKPKVRTGCTTCKARRIKCDEVKPRCNACVFIGRACEYQPLPTAPQRRHRDTPRAILPATGGMAQPPKHRICASPKSAFADLAPRDVTYLEYFVCRLVKQLSYSRLGDSALAAFWSRTVLQQGEHDQHIRDAILSIGALARARASASNKVPLFQHRLSGSLKNEHYCEALHHYTRAVSRTRKLLADARPDAQPRAMLVTCLLFIIFELLQDNARAVDSLTASGIQLLQRPTTASATTAVFESLAGSIDDEGISEAECFVLSSTMNNCLFSPMYPRARERLQDLISAKRLTVPNVVGRDKSLKSFLAVWWNWVICTFAFSFRLTGFVVPCGSPAEIATTLAALEAWLKEAERRHADAQDAYSAYLCQAVIGGVQAVIRGVKNVDVGKGDEKLSVLPLPDTHYRPLIDIFKVAKKQQVGPVGALVEDELELINEGGHDAAIPALLFTARNCANQALRTEALELCGTAVRPSSSWSLKAIYLGVRALIDIEGEQQTANGEVPLSAHHTWTEGYWNEDYTALHVKLTASSAVEGHAPRVRHLILSPQQHGLA